MYRVEVTIEGEAMKYLVGTQFKTFEEAGEYCKAMQKYNNSYQPVRYYRPFKVN